MKSRLGKSKLATSITFTVALVCALSHSVLAQELLVHLPLDGSLQNAGTVGGQATLHIKDGEAAPTNVAGKFGHALHFTGGATLALPFNLSPADYPQVTITAWVKLDPTYRGEHAVVSSGNGNGPRLTVFSGKALLTAGRSTATFPQAMLKNEWVFIAGVADISGAQARVYQAGGELTKDAIKTANLYPPTAYKDPDNPAAEKTAYLFIGSHGFNQWPAKDMTIDDVRVYAGALTTDQINGLRNASAAPSYALASPPAATAASAGALPATTSAERVRTQGVMPELFGDKDRPPSDGLSQTGAASAGALPATTPAERVRTQGVMPELFGDKDRPPGDDQAGTVAPQQTRAGTLTTPRSDLSLISDSKIPQAAFGADGASPGEAKAATGAPAYVADGTTNSQGVRDVLQERQAETALPDIAYGSEEEMQAAADKRAREQGQAELDRQQNELEAQRRAAAAAESSSGETNTQKGFSGMGAGEVYAAGESVFSAVSGYPGENQEIIQLDNAYMNKISWAETADRPCSFSAYGGDNWSQTANWKWGSCKGTPGFNIFQGMRELQLDQDTAINSLQVCSTSHKNKRLKGIRVSGDRINADGTMTYQPAASAAEMANCSEWHTTVLCPSDYVGVGLVIHSNNGVDSSQNVVGLQLVCRKIAVRY